MEILIALVERSPDLIDKRDLVKRVWGRLAVDEVSLRYQLVALRKVLGDGQGGARYITNVSGRGYCFVAPVSRFPEPNECARVGGIESDLSAITPDELVGRHTDIQDVLVRLKAHRIVSLVGPGGVGKTALAVEVANKLAAEFDGQVHFLSLDTLSPEASVSGMLASALGLPNNCTNSTEALLSLLRARRLLLILDSCEHVIDSVSDVADRLIGRGPDISILATTRESLRIEAEQVVHISPLGYPSGLVQTADEAMRFPAVQLFVKLVSMSAYPFALTNSQAPVVCEICRLLEGVPLALELASKGAAVYGITRTAELLRSSGCLHLPVRGTGVLRHRSAYDNLGWSYNLLPEDERSALHRLSRIEGQFSIPGAPVDRVGAPLTESIARLVEKSLVCVDVGVTPPRYWVPEATRAYMLQKFGEAYRANAARRAYAELECQKSLQEGHLRAVGTSG